MIFLARKDKLTNKEMVQHLRSKGVAFDIISEGDAISILRRNTYFFKVTAYRKNFKKVDGTYENLDFAYLTDLASLDMQLRYFVIKLALDYEHSIKTKLLDIITNDPNEDGYSIVTEFKNAHPQAFLLTIGNLKRNKYMKDMYQKRHQDPAIWVLMEVMTFGPLSMFIEFYYKKNRTKSIKNAYNLTKYAKNIRNAAAHNNPLLLNFYSSHSFVTNDQAVVSNAAIMGINNKQLEERKVNDLVALIYLHKTYCSAGLKSHRKADGESLISRARKNPDYYTESLHLKEFYEIFCKLIDAL